MQPAAVAPAAQSGSRLPLATAEADKVRGLGLRMAVAGTTAVGPLIRYAAGIEARGMGKGKGKGKGKGSWYTPYPYGSWW